MAEFEARSRAVYDHDNEEPRPPGRRRRQVADWGVGDEIFDHMPGRRFERRPHQDVPRGDAADGRRTIVIETGDDELPGTTAQPVAADEEFATRDEAIRARQADDELWGGDEPFARRAEPADDDLSASRGEPADERWGADAPFAETRDDDVTEFVAASGGQHDTGEFAPVGSEAPSDHTDGIVRGGQAGRRTVKIGGRPTAFHGQPSRARRPPRAMHERLGPRPDRVAMWAFALGILLILIAIATANA